MKTVKETVREIISEHFSLDEIGDNTSIVELGADSLDGLEIIVFVEEELGVKIPDEDTDRLLTVDQITEYVEALRATV